MTPTLRSFVALDAADRRLLVEAAIIVVLVRCGLLVGGFQRTCRGLVRLTALASAPRSPATIEADCLAARAASRFVPGRNTCLVRAVAAGVLLARHGHEASIRIGVARPGPSGLDAHAWVEHDGIAVLDGPPTGAFEGRLPPLELGRS